MSLVQYHRNVPSRFCCSLKIAAILSVVLFFSQHPVHSQTDASKVWFGFSAGYGAMAMTDINNELNDFYQYFRSYDLPVSSPTKLNGGLYLEGNVMAHFGLIEVNGTISHLTDVGSSKYKDAYATVEEVFDTRTTEIMLSGGVSLPWFWKLSYYARAGLGYGAAGCDYTGGVRSYAIPDLNYKIDQSGTGGYFSTKIQVGLKATFKSLGVQTGIGYRLAKGGTLKGTRIVNGVIQVNQPIQGRKGDSLDFDFSGLLFNCGILFQF